MSAAGTGKRSYKQLVDEDGNTKSYSKQGQVLVDVATLGPRPGKSMQVGRGRHAGLKCVVVKVDGEGPEGATYDVFLAGRNFRLLC